MTKTDDFILTVAQAIERFDHTDGPYILLDAINRIMPFNLAMSAVYRKDTAPVYIADTFKNIQAKRALEHYFEGTYILNPVYNAYLGGLKTGIYRITELAPDAYFSSDHYKHLNVHRHEDEELGYRTYGWPAGMEELIVAIELPEGDMAEISLSRKVSQGGFSDLHIQTVSSIAPIIYALYRRIWQHVKKAERQDTEILTFDHLLNGFCQDTLSPREREVTHLILKGHSSESIGYNLGISIATVKTHRKNLYAKLGLSTQQELFSLFLKSIQKRTGQRSPDPSYDELNKN